MLRKKKEEKKLSTYSDGLSYSKILAKKKTNI